MQENKDHWERIHKKNEQILKLNVSIEELEDDKKMMQKQIKDLQKKLSNKSREVGKDEFSVKELVFLEDCVGFSSAQSYTAKAMQKKLKEMVKEAQKEA